MNRNILYMTIIFLTILRFSLVTASEIVVGYYPSWLRSSLPAENIFYENLSYINHAFVWPEADGSISTYEDFYYPELIERTHAAGKKILLALGGWGQSDGFSPMVASATARSNFINNLVDFCQLHGYDGVDIDWEHPSNSLDRANLTVLIYELRNAFDEVDKSLLLTMAVTASSWIGQWCDYTTMKNYVGWFGCMTYDFHGGWSDHAGHNAPLYAPENDQCGSVHQGVQYLNVTRGIPKEKILIGLPFYGREFISSSLYGPSSGGGEYLYNEILPKIDEGWTYNWDNISKVPYLTNQENTRIISFDDTVSIRIKCEYVKEQAVAGVMIWALGQDVIGNRQPLLETIGRVLNLSSNDGSEHEIPVSFSLNNYPNPFNSKTMIKYYVIKEGLIKLSVYNILGDLVSVIVDNRQKEGWYTFEFDAGDLPSGVYLYKMDSPLYSQINKMAILR